MQCTTEVGEIVSAQDEQVQSLYAVLRQVTDRRHKRGRRYEAATLLVILLLAKLAGERTLSGVAQWARLHSSWLCEHLRLHLCSSGCSQTERIGKRPFCSAWFALTTG